MTQQDLLTRYRTMLPSSFLLSSDEDHHLKQKSVRAKRIDWCIKCKHPYLVLSDSIGSNFCIMCGTYGTWHSCKEGRGHKSDPLSSLLIQQEVEYGI